MRDELPEECTRELDYQALVATLSLLEDEKVCLSVVGLESHPGGKSSRVTVRGVLRKVDHSWADSFAIGGGGHVVLYEPDFVSASLRTYDGNDFFALTMRFGEVSFLVGDESYGLEQRARFALPGGRA